MNARKVLSFALGPILGAAFSLVTVPTIAWMFDAADVGRLNMFQTAISFTLLFSVLGLDQAYGREYHESANRPGLLKACFTPGFLLLIAVAAVLGVFFSDVVTVFLYDVSSPLFYWITALAAIATYISRFLSIILRMEERGLAFSMSQILPKALLLVLVASLALRPFPKHFLHLQTAYLASLLLVLAVYLFNTRRQWRIALAAPLDRDQMSQLISFGAPLILAGFAYWGLASTSTIALRCLSSLEELGVYSVSMSFAGAATVAQAVLSVMWAPTVYKWVATGADTGKVEVATRWGLAVYCFLIVGCGIFSWMISLVLPAQYSTVQYLVLGAMTQPLLYALSEVTCVGINISRKTSLAAWCTVAALATNVLLSLILVPRYGAAGAIESNAAAFLVFFVARTEASAAVWQKFPRRRLYSVVISTTGLCLATAVVGNSLPFPIALVWAGTFPIIAWVFWPEAKEIFGVLRKGIVGLT